MDKHCMLVADTMVEYNRKRNVNKHIFTMFIVIDIFQELYHNVFLDEGMFMYLSH